MIWGTGPKAAVECLRLLGRVGDILRSDYSHAAHTTVDRFAQQAQSGEPPASQPEQGCEERSYRTGGKSLTRKRLEKTSAS